MQDVRLWPTSRRQFAGYAATTFTLALLACSTVPESSSSIGERQVTVQTPDGRADALLFTPGKGREPAPAILLWADISGLRPAFADVGRRLAGEGYAVLIPNSFYRSARIDGSSSPGTLSEEEWRMRFSEWRAAAGDEAIIRDTKAYMAFLDAQPQVNASARAGVLGYDVGAAHAFLAAQALPQRFGAVAVYHPFGIATSRPTSPHLRVGETGAAYYVALSADDDMREPEDKTDLQKAFAESGLNGTVEVLQGNHGFMMKDHAAYHIVSAEQAWSATMSLLHNSLR